MHSTARHGTSSGTITSALSPSLPKFLLSDTTRALPRDLLLSRCQQLPNQLLLDHFPLCQELPSQCLLSQLLRCLNLLPSRVRSRTPHFDQSELTMATDTPTYSSQMTAMRTRATFAGIDLSLFDQISSEKAKIAQNRFPAESVDWQMWLAESLIWVFFCKCSHCSAA